MVVGKSARKAAWRSGRVRGATGEEPEGRHQLARMRLAAGVPGPEAQERRATVR